MRRVQEFKAPHGRVQIVEIAGGACHVGYLRSGPGSKWQHWGLGEGGFDATVERFEKWGSPTFNKDAVYCPARGDDGPCVVRGSCCQFCGRRAAGMKANPLDTYRRMLKASYRDSCHFACEDAGIHDPETTIPALVDALREIAKTASEEIAEDLPHIAEHARAVLAKLEGGPQCGHSACRQYWIDTGKRECVKED